MAQIIVGLKECKLVNEEDSEFLKQLDKDLSFFIPGAVFSRAYKGYTNQKGQYVSWDGRKHLLEKNLSFPAGLKDKVIEFYKNKGRSISIIDEGERTPFSPLNLDDALKRSKKEPYYYQTEAADCVDKYDRGIIRAATGSGKGLISALMTAKIGKPTFIYVIGKDLLYQIHDLYTELFGEEVGIIGDGHCEIKRINIATVWTIGQAFGVKRAYLLDEVEKEKNLEKDKYQSIQKALAQAKLHIFDECHLAACDTIQTIMKNIVPDQIYGMSASPWRDDGADLLIEGYLGKTICEIPAKKLIKEGYLVPPIIKFWPVPKMDLPKNYKTIYKRYVVENDYRNELVIKATNHMIAQGYKPLILFQDLRHGKILYNELKKTANCAMLKGADSTDRRKEVKNAIEENQLQAVLASRIFDIGVDIPSLSGLVIAGAGKSSVRALQRIGRVIRKYPGKTKAAVVDFADQATYLSKHARIRKKIYSMEFDVEWQKK